MYLGCFVNPEKICCTNEHKVNIKESEFDLFYPLATCNNDNNSYQCCGKQEDLYMRH